MEILNSKTFDHYELTKDGLTLYDKEGKALKTLTGEYEDLANVFNFLEGDNVAIIPLEFWDPKEALKALKNSKNVIQKEIKSWGNLIEKGLSSEQRISLKEYLPSLTDAELDEYSDQLSKGKLTIDNFITEINNKKFESIAMNLDIETTINNPQILYDYADALGVSKEKVNELKEAFQELADNGIAYATKDKNDVIHYFDATGKEIKGIGEDALTAKAKLIALGREGIAPLSSYPGISNEVYSSIINAGNAAGWSSTMINSVLTALSNLSGYNLDLSSSISELGECSVEAQRAVAALLMASGIEIKITIQDLT